jgi:5-methylcytosine-specific restriction endonuclease McrA
MLLQKHEEIASLERLEAECLSRDGLSLPHKCSVCGSCFATALAASEHTSHKHAALLVAIAANTGKGKAKAWAAKGM